METLKIGDTAYTCYPHKLRRNGYQPSTVRIIDIIMTDGISRYIVEDENGVYPIDEYDDLKIYPASRMEPYLKKEWKSA